jgi:D-alanine-D-alanine ligase
MRETTGHPLHEGEIIGILHNEPLTQGAPGWEASRDVLVQVEAVAEAVSSLGHQVVMLPFNGNPQTLCTSIQRGRVAKVFNLCESVNEDPTLIGHPAALLELLGISFTGSSAFALMLSTDKLAGKYLLQGAGIRTPRFFLYDGPTTPCPVDLRYPLIAKPRFEDASIGIDQESIFKSREEMAPGAKRLYDRYGPLLIEEYIAGREINVALLGAPEPTVLAIAEIDFSAFPKDLYPIVGYRAKWDETAFEYHHTPRLFPDGLPRSVVTALNRAALHSSQLFQLRDYGRVDVRLNEALEVYVLEVNANPCLSPDAGFCAAAFSRGIDFRELIRRLLDCMAGRR